MLYISTSALYKVKICFFLVFHMKNVKEEEQDSFTTCFKTCGTNSWVLLRGFKKGSFSKSLKTVQKGVKKMFKKTQRGCPTGSWNKLQSCLVWEQNPLPMFRWKQKNSFLPKFPSFPSLPSFSLFFVFRAKKWKRHCSVQHPNAGQNIQLSGALSIYLSI